MLGNEINTRLEFGFIQVWVSWVRVRVGIKVGVTVSVRARVI